MIINLCQICFCRPSKKSCNFLIFSPILTNFLPKCRAQNVDSEKGMALGKRAWRGAIVKVARGNTNCYIQNMKALGLVVSEKKIFLYFHYDAPGAGPVWTPGACMAGFMKRTLLHTKYESSWPCGFREEDFYMFFPIVSLWELSVAMETRVLIRPGPKPNATFPPPQ